jgi:thiamine-phosphate pyrophosphorylase
MQPWRPASVGGGLFPRVYVILDAESLMGRELAVAEELTEAGVELIQYRNKAASAGALFEHGKRLAALTALKSAKLILNDRPDVAALCGAGGVHVGQEDLGVEEARAICGRMAWVGVSTHNLGQFREAISSSADYIAVGPIFATSTKRKPDPVVGTDFICEVRRLTQKPLVAIGGITLENAEQVWQAGADSVAVAHDILSASSPGDRARAFLRLAASIQRSRN